MFKYRTEPSDCNRELTVARREILLDKRCKVMNMDGRSQHLSVRPALRILGKKSLDCSKGSRHSSTFASEYRG